MSCAYQSHERACWTCKGWKRRENVETFASLLVPRVIQLCLVQSHARYPEKEEEGAERERKRRGELHATRSIDTEARTSGFTLLNIDYKRGPEKEEKKRKLIFITAHGWVLLRVPTRPKVMGFIML